MKRFVEQRAESLIDRIDRIIHDKSSEAIRRLRVGTKRWRTLYRLMTMLQPPSNKNNKVERKINRLFRRAGAVRTNQLNRQLTTRLRLPANLEKKVERYFRKKAKKARKRLKKAINSLHLEKLSKRIRSSICPDATISSLWLTHQLCRLMDKEAKTIRTLPLTVASTKQLHVVRKHLKALIELGEVTLTLTPDKAMSRARQRAITLQRRLGDWHDQLVLIGQINDYIARHPGVLGPDKTQVLHKRLEARMRRQTTQIRHRVARLEQWLPLMTPWQTALPA